MKLLRGYLICCNGILCEKYVILSNLNEKLECFSESFREDCNYYTGHIITKVIRSEVLADIAGIYRVKSVEVGCLH